MTAYVSREELSLLPANRISYPAQRASRRRPMGLFARVAAYFERQATLREMAGLNDRELQDLGLSRGDIDHVFDAGFTTQHGR